jgi:anthranilate synthase/aminodeoxychorismate synthase-like glutamine amidotransferase
MILMIDNYDSFTYNLVQYLMELGAEVQVYRNDKITLREIAQKNPKKIVISPGPCTPKQAGISKDVISRFGKDIPILGVCLGHQCIGEVFGATVSRASRLMHGKTSRIQHNGKGLFRDLENPFDATRYHSLLVQRSGFPDELTITAQTKEKEIMGLEHKKLPIYGVQFHPESILTIEGKKLLGNFLSM